MDTHATLARITLRSWTRRFRRGRIEPLEVTAARVLAHVQGLVRQWPGLVVTPTEPLLVQHGIPVVYLVGQLDFWRMVQQSDLGPRTPATLYVMVHRRTLADPWECTCVSTAEPFASLRSRPVWLRGDDSPEAQIFARFWRDLADRTDLVLAGLD